MSESIDDEVARWLALPQPTVAKLSEGAWEPAGAQVVALAELEPERARFEREIREFVSRSSKEQATSVVTLAIDPDLGPEAFTIDIGDDIGVVAGSTEGIFRATRQLLHNMRAQGFVPQGHIESAPAVPERGFHLDAARKYYSPQWIRDLITQLADLGINSLQWHFSEHEGLRLESESGTIPQSTETISREEARELLEHAKSLHVRVVPSLDMPGHLTAMLAERPDLQMDVDPDDGRNLKALDISNPEALGYALSAIDDYLELFEDSAHWNLGADEFVDFTKMEKYPQLDAHAKAHLGPDATGFDLLTDFVNQVAQHVTAKGKTPRVWNDGMFRSDLVTLDPSVEVCWWTNWNEEMRPVSDALQAGHNVLNFDDELLYYVLRNDDWYTLPTARAIWEQDWHPGLFSTRPGREQEVTPPYPTQLLGAHLSVWSDFAGVQTQEEVAQGVSGPVAAVAERAWNAGSSLTLEEFEELRQLLGRERAN